MKGNSSSKLEKKRKLIGKADQARLYSSFGTRLRMLRLAKELTPSRFCHRSGITEISLRKFEKGVLEPKLTTIILMAHALEMSHIDLMNIDFKASDL